MSKHEIPDRDFIYDLETYLDIFLMVVTHAKTRTRWIYEVSDRCNHSAQVISMVYWLKNMQARMFGFNNEGFDWLVVQHLVELFERQGYFTAKDAYDKAQEIFSAQDNSRFGLMIWENQRIVRQGDLFKIHHFDNRARSTSLKKLEINMRSKNVQDLPYDPHQPTDSKQKDEITFYGCHDVSETLKFYLASLDQIMFRDDLAERYPDLGDVLNFNDTKIGKKYFERELEKAIPGICYTKVGGKRTPRQTHRPTIALRDVVSPKVQFQHPQFNRILDFFSSQVLPTTKGFFSNFDTLVYPDGTQKTVPALGNTERKEMKKLGVYRFENSNGDGQVGCQVGGIDFVFGTGGIHGSRHTETVMADDEYDLVDVDVASYYPNLAISNGFYPEHLSEEFCRIYSDVYQMRKGYAKKTAENAMLKLALNGVYGDSGNAYSPFYDPQYMMSITINGQLMLCMLAEWVIARGCKMVQVNTDGITCLVPKARRAEFEDTCAFWENHTGLELEHAEYAAMHIRDVNSYMAVKSGKSDKCKDTGKLIWEPDSGVKRIGAYGYVTPLEDPYTRERGWHKDHSNLLAPKAAEARLVHGQDIAEFVMNHRDPFDFMLSVKVPRSSHLEERWPDGRVVRVQNTCRYYVSTQGCALTKVMPPLKGKPNSRAIGIEKGWTVKVVNDASLFDWNDVNWLYYIEEAKKLTSWVN